MIIRDVPILDLRGIPVTRIAQIERVENVRTVVLDPTNAESFMRSARADVRSHLVVKPDEVLFTGQIEIDDQYLDNLPDGTRYVLVGQALIEGFTTSLFFKKVARMRIYGQVLYADARSAGAILCRAERLQGQLMPMPPRALRWIGATHLDADLLRSVARRPVVSIGPIMIAHDVTVSHIMDGLSSMAQIGEVSGREDAICALLSKCRTRLGTYTLSEEQTKPSIQSALRVVPA